MYSAAPGRGTDLSHGGIGLLVHDVTDPTMPFFLKRIPTFDMPAWQGPEPVRGIAASDSLGMVFITTTGTVAAFDIMTDKKVWEFKSSALEAKPLKGFLCCDQLTVSKDGKTLYIPSDDFGPWQAAGMQPTPGKAPPSDVYITTVYVVDAATGKLIKPIRTPDTLGSHNTILSLDGTRLYVGSKGGGGKVTTVIDTRTNTQVGTVGPFTEVQRTYTINGSSTYLYHTMVGLLGFEVADLRTGKMIHRVDVQGFGFGPGRRYGHGTPSHGIAMSPDEKELWVPDGANHYVHIFDNTVMPPKQTQSFPVRNEIDWITFGIDGKYVYLSTGEIVDASTKKVVAHLLDEYGRVLETEKRVQVDFATEPSGLGPVSGRVTRVGNRYSTGKVAAPPSTASGAN